MRALFITLVAPPYRNVGTDRILRFLKYLPKFNWSADVLSIKNNKIAEYDSSNEHKIPKDTKNYQTSLLRIYRPISALMHILPRGWYNFMASFFMIPDAFIGWFPFLYFKGRKLLSNNNDSYDVIISSSPPHSLHLACLALKKKFSIPWIVDLRDPWVGNPLFQGLTPFHKKFYQFLERLVVKNCNAVIANTKTNAKILSKRYPTMTEKVFCINNGYDVDDFKDIKIKKDKNVMTFFHGGTLHSQYDPEPFFQGLAHTLKIRPDLRKKIKVKLVGNKSEQKKIRKYGLNDIIDELPSVSQKEYFFQLKNSDAAILILNPLNKKINCHFWVPAKLYQYIGAQKPTLAIAPNGDAKKILNDSKLGYCSDPNDIISIRDSIIELFDAWNSGSPLYRPSKATKKFEAQYQTQILCKLLNKFTLNK